MKAKAPEKIYIQRFDVDEEKAKFDKSLLFFDDIWTEEPEPVLENIEYTRTDAFIEKAAEWLNNFYNEDTNSYLIGEDIEKFINYMKGE